MSEKVAASVMVYRVAEMTESGRKGVCNWLRRLADDLECEPEAFSKKFRARYMYSDENGGKRSDGDTPTQS